MSYNVILTKVSVEVLWSFFHCGLLHQGPGSWVIGMLCKVLLSSVGCNTFSLKPLGPVCGEKYSQIPCQHHGTNVNVHFHN